MVGARRSRERRNRESIKLMRMSREAHRSRERQSYHCAMVVKGLAGCYALKAVGSSGLIAAPVLGRAVRVNA